MRWFFLVIGCALALGCVPSTTKVAELEERYIPPDANLPTEEVRFRTVEALPDSLESQFKEGIGWAQVVAIDTANVFLWDSLAVDWWQLLEVNASSDTVVVYSENYDTIPVRKLTKDEGGLYHRYPYWYPPGDEHLDPTNARISRGFLVIHPNFALQWISHWWMSSRVKLKPGCAYLIRARFKMTGNLALQYGVDFWKSASWGGDEENNKRSWNSRWYGGSGWQVVICPIG